MRRAIAIVAVVVLVLLAGCSAVPGGQSTGADADAGADTVAPADGSTNATDVGYSLYFTANDSDAGSELESLSVEYPRENFTVDSAQHGDVVVGVDTDGDGEIDREFDEGAISGVNNNDYSFTLALDTDYTLESGDTVVVRYPAIDNPVEAGEYEVSVTLNDDRTTTHTVAIE